LVASELPLISQVIQGWAPAFFCGAQISNLKFNSRGERV
jgi:hypothetical protein